MSDQFKVDIIVAAIFSLLFCFGIWFVSGMG